MSSSLAESAFAAGTVDPQARAPSGAPVAAAGRLASIDLVRGAIMLAMALDHVRYYFSNRTFQPEDIAQTDVALFLTRWVTHFCAPGFFLLAGIGAWLAASRRSVGDTQRFLAVRGVWMIGLELTLIGFAWSFVPGSSFGGVIWAFGWSFLALAAVLRLGPRVIGAAGLAYLVVHDALDFSGLIASAAFGFLWNVLEVPGTTKIPFVGEWFVLFPVLPWTAVAFVGFGLGPLFRRPVDARRRVLLLAGCVCTLAYLALRLTNVYGNPDTLWITGGHGDFAIGETAAKTLISLLNAEKYPPSLQFLLMTLGPLLLLLGWLARLDSGASRLPQPLAAVVTIGRVPMFFYILHLYLIHLAALWLAAMAGQRTDWLGWMGGGAHPRDGSGFDLWVVYVAWIAACLVLFAACRSFAGMKARQDAWWLRYL